MLREGGEVNALAVYIILSQLVRCTKVFFVHTQVLSLYGQFLVAFDTIVIMPS